MSNRYNYVIVLDEYKPKEKKYFSCGYRDFCGNIHENTFTDFDKATLCSTKKEAEVLLSKVIDYFPYISAYISTVPYTQRTFRCLTWQEFDLFVSAYIAACGCKNRIVSKERLSEIAMKVTLKYTDEVEKNNILHSLNSFNRAVRYFRDDNISMVFMLANDIECTNDTLSFVIYENRRFTYRDSSIFTILWEKILPYLYEEPIHFSTFAKLDTDAKEYVLKKTQYPAITATKAEEEVNLKDIVSNKRKYNLPKHVCWDISNTAAANQVWFCVTLVKGDKRTNTATKTVKEGMQIVAQNRVSEKIWTQAEADAYLNTYDPKMEEGFSVELAKQKSSCARNIPIKEKVEVEEKIIPTKVISTASGKRLYNLPKYVCYDKAESRNRERTVFQTSLRINGKLFKNNLYSVKEAVAYVANKMLMHTDVWPLDKIADYLKTYDPEMENGIFIPSNTPKSPSILKREKNKVIKQLKKEISDKISELQKEAQANDINISINVD